MGDIGRYDPRRYRRRPAHRLLDFSCRRGDNSRDNRWMIQGAPLGSAHAIWHVALPVIQLLSTFYPGEKVDSIFPEPLPGRIRADTGRARPPLLTGTGPPGRIPARVKYIA